MSAKRENRGKLYIWTYPESSKGYAGWHVTADRVECARLSKAIEALSTGSLSQPLSFAVSPVTPAVLAVPNYRSKARSARELRVVAAGDAGHFSLEERDDVLTIEAGGERLEELRKNIIGITEGKGDFSMVGDRIKRASDQRLWFWW